MQRSKKQDELFEAYKTGKYFVYALGGGAGSAKTIGILMLLNAICETCPGVRIAIFRKSEKVLKNNLIPSYRKLLSFLGKKPSISDMKAHYSNGSEILFLWGDISKDPDCDNAKGGEFTIAYLNEANQMDQKYYNILKTRVGRWNEFESNGKKYKIKPSIFLDFNPTDNWVKDYFYDPYINNRLPDDVYFQLSLPKDNPFLTKEYMAILETLPYNEHERYVKGNWNYSDDPNQLIHYEDIKDSLIRPEDFVYIKDRNKTEYLGIDVAREGGDKTVETFIQNNILYKQNEKVTTDGVIAAEEAILHMQEKGIGAANTAVDVIGWGASCFDHLTHKGYGVYPYNSSNSPDTAIDFYEFKNKRASSYWSLRQDLKEGDLLMIDIPPLRKELLTIRYFIKNKTIQIEEKAEIKKRLGKSPDRADSACIANYIRRLRNRGVRVPLCKGSNLTSGIMKKIF